MTRFASLLAPTLAAIVSLCGVAVGEAAPQAPPPSPSASPQPPPPPPPPPPLGVESDAPPHAEPFPAVLPIGTPTYNWGIGWDAGRGFVAGGIAIRRRIDEEWGLGFIVDANVSGEDDEGDDRSGDRSEDYGSTSEAQLSEDATYDAYGLRGFVFHETRVTDWFGLGPYCGMGYGYDRRDTDELRVSTRVTDASISTERRQENSTRISHSWAFTLGLRPSFIIEERFILETRLGVTAVWTDSETRSTTYSSYSRRDGNGAIESSSSVDRRDSDDNAWRFAAFGQELGPGAVLSFIVKF